MNRLKVEGVFFQEYDGMCGENPDNVHAANVDGQQSHCFYLIRAERSWLESVSSSFWMENWSFCFLFHLGGVARPYRNVCYKKFNIPPATNRFETVPGQFVPA